MTPDQIKPLAIACGLDFETMDAELVSFASSIEAALASPAAESKTLPRESEGMGQCINCGLPIDPKCYCARGRALAAGVVKGEAT